MRGGERLVKKCSWMSDICSRLYHSTRKFKTFSCRCPSSLMVNNRFRSAEYLPCQLFNFGMIATGNHNFERFAALCNTLGGSQGVLTFSVCEPVPGQYRTGRVREPMYWYKLCALLSGGTAARADAIRPYWSTSFKTSSL